MFTNTWVSASQINVRLLRHLLLIRGQVFPELMKAEFDLGR